ncbi:MAG: hypothetical protein J6P98_01225 [Clostridia bacterium]|nr:hypothetical protein [Clostridia bacterium]
MDNNRRKHLIFGFTHILLYTAGLVLMVLMYVKRSKTLCVIGLVLMFFALLLTFINAVLRIKAARAERKE